MEGGKAAVGVLAPVSEAQFVSDKLAELGGAAETHEVSDEALEEAHAAATTDQAASTDEAAATDEAASTDEAAATDEAATADQAASTDEAASTDQA